MKAKLHYKYNRPRDWWNITLTNSKGVFMFRHGPFQTLALAKGHVKAIFTLLNTERTEIVVDAKHVKKVSKPKATKPKVKAKPAVKKPAKKIAAKTSKKPKQRRKSPTPQPSIFVYDRFGQRTIV